MREGGPTQEPEMQYPIVLPKSLRSRRKVETGLRDFEHWILNNVNRLPHNVQKTALDVGCILHSYQSVAGWTFGWSRCFGDAKGEETGLGNETFNVRSKSQPTQEIEDYEVSEPAWPEKRLGMLALGQTRRVREPIGREASRPRFFGC
jgi:hypothetical protein